MVLRRYALFEVLFVLALATKPLYLLKSGNIQISDALFCVALIVGLFSERKITIDKQDLSFLNFYVFIILYQLIMNIIGPFLWSPNNNYELIVKANLYYIFNYIVLYCVFMMVRRSGLSRTIVLYMAGTIISILISLIGVFVDKSPGVRVSGFFNNPNQLGYFCIVTLTAVVLFKSSIPIWTRVFCLIACSYMCLLSLSKAAIIALAIVFFCFANDYKSKLNTKRVIISLFSIAIVILVLYVFLYSKNSIISEYSLVRAARNRLLNMMGESDSNFSTGRGYGRIAEIGGFALCGVGEGFFGRFTALKGAETHSTYASIIVSYGVIGLLMYCVLFCKAIYSRLYGLRYTILFLGIIAYGFTHNGIRNTLLWTLLAMSYCTIRKSSYTSHDRKTIHNSDLI